MLSLRVRCFGPIVWDNMLPQNIKETTDETRFNIKLGNGFLRTVHAGCVRIMYPACFVTLYG